MRKLISIFIAVMLLAGLSLPVQAAGKAGLDSAVESAAAYIANAVKNPQVDSIGGEWAVIGLARSGYDVPDSYYEGYYRTVEKYVQEHGAILHDKKYTDNSRVILGLTAAGYDPRDVAGHDLTMALGDFENTVWQGINGPIFALIALDSYGYPIPANPDAKTQATRDMYIEEILSRQLNDGGWNLSGGTSAITKNQPSDPDLTGMALQALAEYQRKPEVKAAIDKALTRLSAIQDSNGGFSGWGADNVESTVQVLVALCELGIHFDDPRFVKDGKTAVDNILSFRNSDGSYQHTGVGEGNNQMATEQAFYGLVAAQRSLDGRNSLYDMTDSVRRGEFLPNGEKPSGAGLPGKHRDVASLPVTSPGKAFADTADHPDRAAIQALAERGIISGINETSFDPGATMTRAQFATIAVRGLGLDQASDPQSTVHDHHFDDVTENDWFCGYVYAAAGYEIVNGASATTFNPNGTVTRQEAGVLIARAARLCGMDTERTDAGIRDTLAKFDDYRSVAGWAQESLAFCYDTGILDDSSFYISPGGHITRGEIAGIFFRLLEKAELL